MTTALCIWAGLCLIPFVVAVPALLHSNDLTWLERELERRLEEAEEDEHANDNSEAWS